MGWCPKQQPKGGASGDRHEQKQEERARDGTKRRLAILGQSSQPPRTGPPHQRDALTRTGRARRRRTRTLRPLAPRSSRAKSRAASGCAPGPSGGRRGRWRADRAAPCRRSVRAARGGGGGDAAGFDACDSDAGALRGPTASAGFYVPESNPTSRVRATREITANGVSACGRLTTGRRRVTSPCVGSTDVRRPVGTVAAGRRAARVRIGESPAWQTWRAPQGSAALAARWVNSAPVTDQRS